MALSGLGLVLFVLVHLAGNIPLYFDDGGEAFNRYVVTLESFGVGLLLAEIGLLLLFLLHIVTAISLSFEANQARTQAYQHGLRTKGGESVSNLSSRHMVFTGILLLFFLVIHILQFRFGVGPDFIHPAASDAFMTEIDGHRVRDVYALVNTTFKNPFWVAFYCSAIILFGFHIRHGLWSFVQSLGLPLYRHMKFLYFKATVIAIVLWAGFFFIPLYLHLR